MVKVGRRCCTSSLLFNAPRWKQGKIANFDLVAQTAQEGLIHQVFWREVGGEHDQHVERYFHFPSIVKREEIRQAALARSDRQKDRAKDRHNLGVRTEHVYSPGSLVMLWDAKAAGKKLRPAWRGPFVITGYGGNMERSYTLRQVNGLPIPRHYYGDHLKPFRLREGYLITCEEEEIPVYQNLRLGNVSFKLPKYVDMVPGVHGARE